MAGLVDVAGRIASRALSTEDRPACCCLVRVERMLAAFLSVSSNTHGLGKRGGGFPWVLGRVKRVDSCCIYVSVASVFYCR